MTKNTNVKSSKWVFYDLTKLCTVCLDMELIAIGPLICGLILALSCLTGLDGTPTADGKLYLLCDVVKRITPLKR